uniref:G-protein coupled receptors family 3 profile domain-containing protein n=1 Tax=Denticeps clupeoides TaxID=299321 RepID=A0AAY4CKB7_9TELE
MLLNHLPLLFGLCMLGTRGAQADRKSSLCGAQADGDVLIGILSSCHANVNSLFVRMLADIYTIDVINDSGFLPGVHLGYIVCDPCADATKSLHCVEHMLSANDSLPIMCDYSEFRPDVKVFLGSRYSELSISVAKLLSLYLIPQISTTSSSPALSDKLRYPSFGRVIPSDVHQTKAFAKLMSRFSWDWIGVVSADDEYGKAALQSFLQNAEKAQVCVAYQEVIPYYLDHDQSKQRIKKVVTQIKTSKAQVVLLILRPELVQNLFQEVIQTNTTRTWIASDAWSMNGPLANMKDINKVGEIFGVINNYIKIYKKLRFNCTTDSSQTFQSPQACSIPDPLEANDDYLVKTIDLSMLYSESVAVWTIAHAIKTLLECNETECPGEKNFPPWKLLEKIKTVNFTLNNQSIFFNKDGDFDDSYDLIKWQISNEKTIFKVVGRYNLKQSEVVINPNAILWDLTNTPVSRCSDSCSPGTSKKVDQISCCYTCIPCDEGSYSDNLNTCHSCPNGTWSLKGASQCASRTIKYLQWFEPYPIVLLVAAGIGYMLIIIAAICYTVHRDKPIIKSSNFEMSCLMMLGLAVSFGSVIAFMDKPNIHLCRAQQTMYAMGFTLCVSCILVKAFRTFLAFMAFDPVRQERLGKLYNPLIIVVLGTAVQGIICIFWLIYDSPDVDNTPPSNQSMIHVLQCTGGSNIGFAVMHSYIALLAFICFLLAFKGRKVPHDFSETGIIIFSMLIHLFVWLCFIPIYITKDESRPIVQASAILVSNFGIIFCHLVPKCYRSVCSKSLDFRSRLQTFVRHQTATNVPSIPRTIQEPPQTMGNGM